MIEVVGVMVFIMIISIIIYMDEKKRETKYVTRCKRCQFGWPDGICRNTCMIIVDDDGYCDCFILKRRE